MGHWLEILAILVLALLVFGPKRMVDMGSSLGKAFREFRDSTKDINFSQMLSGTGDDEEDDPATRITPITAAPHIVEGSIERSSAPAATDTSSTVDAAEVKIVPTTSEAQPK